MDVHHDSTGQRFVVVVEGEEAVVEYDRANPTTMDIHHTFVPDVARGMGVAGHLMRAALEHAKAEGYRVVPTCSYAAKYIEKHPEYAALASES